MGPDDLSTPPIVSAEWVDARRDDVVVCDVRWYLDGRSGRAAYDEGHIPGAVFVDLDRWLAAPPTPEHGRHPLPDPELFAEGMCASGIADDSVVIAYDDLGGMVAARLVWMLRITGHEAAVLNGGLAAWPHQLSTIPVNARPATFLPQPWPSELLATADDVATSSGPVIDARAAARYTGETEPVDPRPGHIPGAINLDFGANLDRDGRFVSADRLRDRYRGAGVTSADDTIVYCGSGVSACHNLLAMEAAGLGVAKLYVGSWSQWSADPDRPAAMGDEPGSV